MRRAICLSSNEYCWPFPQGEAELCLCKTSLLIIETKWDPQMNFVEEILKLMTPSTSCHFISNALTGNDCSTTWQGPQWNAEEMVSGTSLWRPLTGRELMKFLTVNIGGTLFIRTLYVSRRKPETELPRWSPLLMNLKQTVRTKFLGICIEA